MAMVLVDDTYETEKTSTLVVDAAIYSDSTSSSSSPHCNDDVLGSNLLSMINDPVCMFRCVCMFVVQPIAERMPSIHTQQFAASWKREKVREQCTDKVRFLFHSLSEKARDAKHEWRNNMSAEKSDKRALFCRSDSETVQCSKSGPLY